MNQPARMPPKTDAPELYQGIKFEVDEILLGIKVLQAKARDIAGSFEYQQTVSMKIAVDDVAKIGSQVSILAAHLSSVLTRHVNRRARVS